MNNENRWKQRFQNFEKAFAVFQRRIDAYEGEPEDEAFRMSLIQAFEILFELSWKTLKDYLENEGVRVVASPKKVVREAFKLELFTECEDWLESWDVRNRTTHVYDEESMLEVIDFIREKFYPIARNLRFCLKREM